MQAVKYVNKILILVGILWINMCYSYDSIAPEWVCCIKYKVKGNGFKEEEILVDPEEKDALINCGYLANRKDRARCASKYINPWEFHHREDERLGRVI